MKRRAAAMAALCLVVVGLATACASSGSLTVTDKASRVLLAQVQTIRAIAASGNRDRLARAIAALDAAVEQDRRNHQVSSQRANQIEDAAGALLAAFTPSSSSSSGSSQSASPSPSPTHSASPTATPTPTTTPTPSESSSPSPSSTFPIGIGHS